MTQTVDRGLDTAQEGGMLIPHVLGPLSRGRYPSLLLSTSAVSWASMGLGPYAHLQWLSLRWALAEGWWVHDLSEGMYSSLPSSIPLLEPSLANQCSYCP